MYLTFYKQQFSLYTCVLFSKSKHRLLYVHVHVLLATDVLPGLVSYILPLRLHNQLLPEIPYGKSCNSEWIEREQHVHK